MTMKIEMLTEDGKVRVSLTEEETHVLIRDEFNETEVAIEQGDLIEALQALGAM